MPTLPNADLAPAPALRAPTIRRNLVFNVAGVLFPLIAAFVAIPMLVGNFGLQRFGIFMLLMAAIAYVGLLDLGLGAAVTYRIPALIAQKQPSSRIVAVVHTALIAAFVLGSAVCAACLAATAWVPLLMTDSPPGLVRETADSLRLLALAVPATFVASVLAGVLSAHGEFVMVNKVRIPTGVLSFLAPAVASLWWHDLVLASALLLALRLAMVAAHGWQCKKLLPTLGESPFASVSADLLRSLVHFGGWLTVSNIVGPFMVYMDRFYLAALQSAADVASYVTPYELAIKLSLLPAAVLPVLFPIFVAGWVQRSRTSDELPVKVAAWVALGCAGPAAFLAAFAPQILGIWLQGRLPQESAAVLQILAGAVLVNCVAQVFFLQVQARGRTSIIARIHIAELLGYGILLLLLTSHLGITGVALAWAIRVVVDAALFCHVAAIPLGTNERRLSWAILSAATLFGAALAALSWIDSWGIRMVFLAAPIGLAWMLRQDLAALWRSVNPAAAGNGLVTPEAKPHG